ncbi:MAG: hypothetical protein H6737_06015 [Alphaproteobacteria bacterium]|nr:hypothetical protein [Alphaproteobacteria bacterium]
MSLRRAGCGRFAVLAVAVLVGCVSPDHCPTGRLCSVMGNGELGFNGDGLPAAETRLASPTSVAVAPDGRPVAVDYSNMRLRVVRDGLVETLVGSGEHAYSELGVDARDTPLENPIDAKWGPDGVLYVLPQHEGRVIMIGPDDIVEPCIGTGIIGDYGDGVHALDARMGFGAGLAIDSDGTVYISDQGFNRVRRVGPDGTIRTVLGTGSAGEGAPGYGPEVAIAGVERIALDVERNRLLVADAMNHRVLAMDLDDLQVTLVAGSGARGYAGDGGPAVEAELNNPVGVEVTPDGHVLIGDLANRVIRVVTPEGTISTLAGGGDPEVHGYPARPEEAPLRGPAGMAWSDEGDLLIADRSGHRILRWRGVEDAL